MAWRRAGATSPTVLAARWAAHGPRMGRAMTDTRQVGARQPPRVRLAEPWPYRVGGGILIGSPARSRAAGYRGFQA
jgi:hypothetical protein